MAAMLLVNNPGDWGHVFAPLEHSAWHGCTPTDLIFPFFLFIVGVSLALALGPRLDAQAPIAPLRRTVLVRAARILALGMVLHLLAWWLMGKPELRIPGVLQRIAICFALSGLVVLHLRRSAQQWGLLAAAAAGLRPACWPGAAASTRSAIIASRWDAALCGRFGYEWNAATGLGHDPEGLVSTLGALATSLLGLQAGQYLRRAQWQQPLAARSGQCLSGPAGG